MNEGTAACSCCLDLGFPISEDSAVLWPTCRPLAREVIKAPETTEGPGARSKQSFTLNGGSGTHIDAPSHFVPGGRTVDMLRPRELAAVSLAIVDCRADAAASADHLLCVAAIEADEAQHGPIPEGALVCVRTGWAAARFESRDAYCNMCDPEDIDTGINLPRMHFPGVSKEAAAFLVEQRRAVGVGIDTLSPDGGDGGSRGFPAHHVILGADRYILENLRLDASVPARGATVFVSPLNIVGAPEAPARVWAVIP